MVNVAVAGNSGAEVVLAEEMIGEFGAGIRGEVILEGDAGYDGARAVFNRMIDRKPALIARCTGAADVIKAVDFARSNDLKLTIRGGGHNVAGHALAEKGFMIDLSGMNSVHVDAANRTARAQGGATWGDLDHETQAFGLATTGGIATTTGIGGLTLGGGLGYLNRKYGLTCDNLLSADVVTADGQLLTASATENSDLFWALRGGGGNFGVVTSFEYQLHPVGQMLGGVLAWPLPMAKEVLRFYRDFAATAPDELRLDAVIHTSPHGPALGMFVTWCGSVEDGERTLRPLREFGSPVMDTVAPVPYAVMQGLLESLGYVPGHLNYWKSRFVNELSDELIDAAVEMYASNPSPKNALVFEQMGGAISRIGDQETAFSHRQAAYAFLILGFWDDPGETDQNIAWVREVFAAVEPFVDAGIYVNYLGEDETESHVQQAYGANYERLLEIKRKYDPNNLFRQNQNIRP